MKKLHYILVLSIIFTGYLFSQTEENETIKTDTAINIDSVTVTKTDKTIIAELANEQEEKKEFEKYDDLFSIYDCKETGTILVKLSGNRRNLGFSATFDIPISCNINIASIYTVAIGGLESDSPFLGFFGIGLDYISVKTDNFILKSRACLGLLTDKRQGSNYLKRPGLNLGTDILFRFKFIALSIGPDFFIPFKGRAVYSPAMISLGLGIVYLK